MTEKIKIEFIDAGFKAILLSDEVYNLVKTSGQTVAARAGDGFSAKTMKGYWGSRWVSFVSADTAKARREEAEHKVLSRAI